MQAAAERWGANFLEINEGMNPGIPVSPASLKCFCFRLSGADEFFILDADTVVSSQCPNPFETFTGPELVAVPNGSDRFGDLWAIRSCEAFEWNKLQREEPRVAGAVYSQGQYFNTGMMVVRRLYHEALFELISDIVQVDHGLGWCDQTPIVASAAALGSPVRLVGEEWNFIHPCVLGPNWLSMRATGKFIYHFAGEPGREHVLPTVAWQ